MQDGFVSGEIQKWHCHASIIWLHSKTFWNSFQLANKTQATTNHLHKKEIQKNWKDRTTQKILRRQKCRKDPREKNNAQINKFYVCVGWIAFLSWFDGMRLPIFLSLLCIEAVNDYVNSRDIEGATYCISEIYVEKHIQETKTKQLRSKWKNAKTSNTLNIFMNVDTF